MKIDTALHVFSEKYDREAIESIERISSQLGLQMNGYTVKAFNLTEAFNRFSEYLQGYGAYKAENVDNPKASTQDAIKENVSKFIDGYVFEEKDVKCTDLPGFVRGYVEGITSLIETVDAVKSTMLDAGVAQEAVGDVNDFVDCFMDKLQESFDPAMNRILWASGYNARQRMKDVKSSVRHKPVFL